MKFSIRDLLLMTAIVALAVGWAVDHWKHAGAAEDAKFLAEFAAVGGYHEGLPRFERLCRKYGASPDWVDHGND